MNRYNKIRKTSSSFFALGVLTLVLSFSFPALVKAQPCITVFPHVDDFEAAPTWTAFTAPTSTWTSSDWAWGTPNHAYVIQSAGSGAKCWCVGTLTGAFYNFWQQSYVQSPCYDFTNLQYPHVQFKLFYDSEYKFDGGNLQSSIDGGVTWQDVGTVGGTAANPIPEATDCNTENWYNYTSVSYLNNPAGFVTSKHGWCGNVEPGGTGWDTTVRGGVMPYSGTNCVGGNGLGHWVTAQHCLTGLAGQSNVLLRFTFAAGFSCNDFDGFAFDSVAVGNGIINTTTITPTCGGGHTMNFNSGVKACPTTTWAWNFGDAASGGSNTSTAQNPSHTFSGPGVYTVSVIASGGACNPPDTATTVVHVLGVSITSFTNASCANPGSAISLAANATTPTYSWSNGAATAAATGLTNGSYTVTVTDPGNPSSCPTMTIVTITQPNPIVISLTSTAASCNSNNGTASTVSVTGGTPAYTFSWSPSGGTAATASNLTAGLYSLTVTDVNNCTGTQTVQVTNASGPQVTVSSTSVTCFGASTGTGSTSVTGGVTPITYSWSTGAITPSVTGLSNGTYTIIVTDASPCAVTNIITITQPTAINTVTSSTAATCGQSNGMASITVSGGTPGYTYNWSPTGGNTANATGLGLGTYTISGMDANACTYSTQVTVTQQSAVNVTVTSTPASCGNNNGTATANATGGFPATTGYTYTWSPVGGNTNMASNLAPSGATYSIIVGDSLGCTTTQTVNIANHSSPVLTINSTSITCNGLTNGTALCTINAGTGTSPFTYTWSPVGGNNALASNLGIGTYTVNVTDSYSCTAMGSVTINQPPALTVTATGTSATCGNANGSTTCTATGGTPAYNYAWTSGATTATVSNLFGNITYTVTVTDANNCVQTASVLVNGTPALTLSVPTITNVTCNGGNNGAISVTPGGGTGAITYTWTPSGGNNPTASGLSANVGGTTYSVFATDAVGCPANTIATINEPPPVVVAATIDSICFGQTGLVGANFSGGNGGPYTWTSTDGVTTSGIMTNPPTNNTIYNPTTTSTYTIVAQDNKGCLASAVATIFVLTPLNITVSTNDTVCPGQVAQLNVTSESGGLGAGHYTVTWLPSGATGNTYTATPNSTTTYTAILSDGCTITTATTTGTVYTYPVPVISYSATPLAGCAPLTANFSPIIGGTGIFSNQTWGWNFDDGSSSSAVNGVSHTYVKPGLYSPTLTVTTVNGCVDASGSVDTIRVYPQPQANFTASSYTTDIYDNTIHFTDLSTCTPAATCTIVSTVWNFIGQNNPNPNVQNPTYTFYPEGTYSVSLTVINQYGCQDEIVEEIVITPYFTFYAPNCVTPNGDGLNEVFLPIGDGWDLNQFDLWIFDRWGHMFHHTSNPYGGWDGTKNDHVVQEDTYVWKVSLFDVFGNPHEYHGIVSVVR